MTGSAATSQDPPRTLAELRARFADLAPPVVTFNKSHSGSRLLARVLAAGGVFIGAVRNESEDSLPLFDVVERLVVDHYPDYGRLLGDPDPPTLALIEGALRRHLDGFAGDRWGWKLCETTFILPVVDAVFPRATYVHLLRDGRDVAMADHVAPRTPFWRKVYFNTADVRTWRGLPLGSLTYRLLSPLFNARHWSNSVSVGRAAGRAMGARYHEVRYEDIVGDFEPTTRALFAALGLPFDIDAMAAVARTVNTDGIGRFRRAPLHRRWLAALELEPTLRAFGYGGENRGPGDAR
jgi:hypothetical protein